MLIKFLYKFFPRILFFIRKVTFVNQESEMELLHILCCPNKTSLDVGAKFGMYTFRLKRYSKKVIAFEPIRDLNIALSIIFQKENVDIIPFALSGKSGEFSMRTPLYKSGNPCYGRSTIEVNNHLEFDKIEGCDEFSIQTIRLDDLNIENIGFIKIDVEGHEQSVLEGASHTIKKFHPTMLIEANNTHLPDATNKLFKWAEDNNYKVFFMENNNIRASSEFIPYYHYDQLNLENFILIYSENTACLQNLMSHRNYHTI
ncbi:MAG: FkbM family methyltransferase [Emcibacter sp.]|nr:FkbM family methyltransferase [Emcibacter sp.]